MFRFLRGTASLRSSAQSLSPLRLRASKPAHVALTARLQFASARAYSSPAGGPKRKPNEQLPKLRYFFLIMAVGTVGFLVSLNYVGEKRTKGEISPEEYEKIRAKPRKRAFDANDTFVVFVLGGPGSGKGTQCDLIVRDYDFVHLSAGDLLRAEQERPDSQYGDLIKSYIKSGQIVPQEITINLLINAMRACKEKGVSHFLIDGFPRKMDQALTFEDTVVPSRFTLFFQCPEKVMLERLLNRGKTSGRADDNLDSIRKRFKVFEDDSMPVVRYFETADKVATLYCNDPIDDVYHTVQETLKKHGVEPKAKKAEGQASQAQV